jgi:hypothetical protein
VRATPSSNINDQSMEAVDLARERCVGPSHTMQGSMPGLLAIDTRRSWLCQRNDSLGGSLMTSKFSHRSSPRRMAPAKTRQIAPALHLHVSDT